MPKKLNWKLIDPATDFKYEEPRANANDGSGASARVTARDPDTGKFEPLIFQGPKLRLPFGCDKKDIGSGERYYATMAFPSVRYDPQENETYNQNGDNTYCSDDSNREVLEFFKFWRAVDNANKAAALQNVQAWFKKNISANVIEEFYYSCVTYDQDEEKAKKYSPKLSTKLITNANGDLKTEFFNQLKEKIDVSKVRKGSVVIPIIRTRGLWFAGKSFGMSLQIEQAMIFQEDQFDGCAIDLGEEDAKAPSSPPLQIDIEDEDAPAKKKQKIEFNMPQEPQASKA